MDAVDQALTIFQNDRRQLQNLRQTKVELLNQRKNITEQLPLIDRQIEDLRAKVRASRLAFVAAATSDD